MSKNFKGYMGDQIGKLGTAVGRRWKRKMVYSAYQGRVRNPKSPEQLLVRGRFKVLNELSNELQQALEVGYVGYADARQCTERNSFMRRNYGAVTGSTEQALAVEYEMLEMSHGALPSVQFGEADFTQAGLVAVPITNANLSGSARNDDKVYLVAYCPDMCNMAMNDGRSVRTDDSVSVTVPASWQGLKVYIYGFLQRADDKKRVSSSVYLGCGNLS